MNNTLLILHAYPYLGTDYLHWSDHQSSHFRQSQIDQVRFVTFAPKRDAVCLTRTSLGHEFPDLKMPRDSGARCRISVYDQGFCCTEFCILVKSLVCETRVTHCYRGRTLNLASVLESAVT